MADQLTFRGDRTQTALYDDAKFNAEDNNEIVTNYNAAVTEINLNTDKITYPISASDKLATVETNAKDDQTGAEIKASYEAEANTNVYNDTEKAQVATNAAHSSSSSQAHSDYLKNNESDVGVQLVLSGDNLSADTQYTAQVLYNTDETPPAASGFPIGTIYIQYTA